MLTVTAADLAAHDLLTPTRATLLARGVILRLADDGSVHVDGPDPAEVWAEADAAEAEARAAATPRLVDPGAIRLACAAIRRGDLDRARAELGGPGYSLGPSQIRDVRWALREAAAKFNAPHLAERDALSI